MNVAELKEELAKMPDDLEVVVTSVDYFPFTRKINRIQACATRAPFKGGALAIMGRAVGPALLVRKGEDDPTREDQD